LISAKKNLLLLLFFAAANPVGADRVVISEFLAINDHSLKDRDGDRSDWIELFNASNQPVDLAGWHLTDAPETPEKWTFPPHRLAAGAYLVVFASGKNRIQGDEFHTSFKLRGDGEYLALVRPDHSVASEFAPAFPAQTADISYGREVRSTILEVGAQGQYWVPEDDRATTDWLEPGYDAGAWSVGSSGFGYERAQGYETLIGTDLEGEMYDGNTSVYLRFPFTLDDPTKINSIVFRIRFDDGFIAYLNGRRFAVFNAPAAPSWNSAATGYHDDSEAKEWSRWTFPPRPGLLRQGENVLAIHSLNENPISSDLLLVPRMELHGAPEIVSLVPVYLPQSTPGADNVAGTAALGPVIAAVEHSPRTPEPTGTVVVRATVEARERPLGAVRLHYRVMFGDEISLAMADDGLGDDQTADDGIYTGTIPSGVVREGQMARWYVTAEDRDGNRTRRPPFSQPENMPQYWGTVCEDPTIESPLPIFHWFVEEPARAQTDLGTRASLFFDGRFYDNIHVRHRGLWTRSWPKRKFKFDFNPRHRFSYDPDQPEVEEFNLQSHYWEWESTSYMRENLAYHFFNQVGTPSPLTFHLHLRQNGRFFGLFSFIEQVDDTFLRRNGIDRNSPMYKALQDGTLAPHPTVELYRKVNQKNDPWDDFKSFTNGLSGLGATDRFTYIYDHVDLAQIVNEMAAQTIVQNHDRLIKNYYMYLDPTTQEWHRIPWDTEASFPLSEKLNAEHWASPLFGDNDHVQELCCSQWINFLVDAMLDNPPTRQMYLRRLRTLMDRYLAEERGYFEGVIDSLGRQIATDAVLDRVRWGLGSSRRSIDGIVHRFLVRRRAYLFDHPLVPSPQADSSTIEFGRIEGTGPESQQFIELVNPNPVAVDISGWRLDGDVEIVLQPGTVINARADSGGMAGENGVIFTDGFADGWSFGGRPPDYTQANKIYLSPDVVAFRKREKSPGGGERLFVQGNYERTLSPMSGRLELRDEKSRLVAVARHRAGETAISEKRDEGLLQAFSLEQNRPNPFNSSCTIRFLLSRETRVDLAVFNLSGQKVVALAQGHRSAGIHQVRWDGRDAEGRSMASGVYLYRLRAGNYEKTRSLVLLK